MKEEVRFLIGVQKLQRSGPYFTQIVRGGAIQPASKRSDRVYGATLVGYIGAGCPPCLLQFHLVLAEEILYTLVLNLGSGWNAELDASLHASRFALHLRY